MGRYYNSRGKKILEEIYFICDDNCEDTHPSHRQNDEYICKNLGKIISSKEWNEDGSVKEDEHPSDEHPSNDK